MLIAQTNGVELAKALRPIIETLRGHSAELSNQLERAAISVVLNVAEGSKRSGRDPRRYFTTAHGSAAEVRACLELAAALGWDVDTRHVEPLLDRQLALLWSLTRKTRKKTASTTT